MAAGTAASLFDNFCILDVSLGKVCPNSNSDAFPLAFPAINFSTVVPKPAALLLVRRSG
jgi:hypothetical protein